MSLNHDGAVYRSQILSRLEQREKKQRSTQTMFRNYATLADQLSRMRKVDVSSRRGSSLDELSSLREEIGNVYKMKSKNDQDLIEANRKLGVTETELRQVTVQRNKLKSDWENLVVKVAKLEKEMIDLKENNRDVNMERVALLASCNALTAQKTELENERYQLMNKIRELQDKHADLMNAEIVLQEERAFLKMKEQIARASEDITYDERASSAFGHSPETSDEYIMTDILPERMGFRAVSHENEVNDIEWFTEDTFATGGNDKKVRIWSVSKTNNEPPKKLASLEGCNGAILRIDYDSDKRTCLAASSDHTCRIWNVDSRRLLQTFTGHEEKVTSARFIQSHHVISGSMDRTIKQWDVPTLRCVKTFPAGSSVFDIVAKCGIYQTCFISGHYDKTLRFWDTRQIDPVRTVTLGNRVCSLDTSMDGLNVLASCRDDTLSMLDVRTFNTIHMYSSENYRSFCDLSRAIFSSTDEYVAAGSSNGSIFLWNTKTTKLEKVLRTSKAETSNAILSLSWNPSGHGLLACDRQKTSSYWK